MTWSAISKQLAQAKSYVTAVAFLFSAFLVISAVSKVPGKLEAHAIESHVQNDSILVQLHITNQLLRASLCIQVRADTPAGCMLKP